MSGQDQRQFSRVTVNKEFASIESFIAEYVTNVSRGGVFIRSRQPLPVGTRVNLRFTLLIDEIETIEGIGEVVRVLSDGEDTGMGVEFRELSAEARAIIDRLLAIPR
jgi:uncharacterized protein (TIGR02266 family)